METEGWAALDSDSRAAFENVVNFIAGAPTGLVNPDALRVLRRA